MAQAKVGKEVFQKARKVIESSFYSDNASLREAVAQALGEMPFPNDTGLLRQALSDSNEYVRIAAALSLGKKKDTSGGAVLQDILENTRTPTGGNPILVQFQSIAVAKKRCAAAEALGELGDQKFKYVLQLARRDRDPRVRDAVAIGLARLGDKTELIVFHSALNDKDDGVRLAAMEAVAKIAAPESQSRILAGLKDPSPEVRSAALRGLQRLKNPGVWRDVAALLRDENAMARESAAETLEIFQIKEAVGPLKLLLEDENGYARAAAAKSLGRLGDRNGVDVLKSFMVSSDTDLCVRALQGLAVFPDESEWGALARYLENAEDRVRLAAAVGIWKKGGLR